MTAQHYPRPNALLHECTGAMECASTDAGHALGLIHDRVATATPSKWVDAVVVSASVGGWIELAVLQDDSRVWVWNHSDLTASLATGVPVVLHSVYDVLGAGEQKHSVLRVEGISL